MKKTKQRKKPFSYKRQTIIYRSTMPLRCPLSQASLHKLLNRQQPLKVSSLRHGNVYIAVIQSV